MNKTKREKTLTCVLSALLPIMLFLGAACLLNYIPFGNINFEIFDSHEQYSGFIMALKEALSSGNFLHSWSGGLGFNLYSSLTYYAFSPLNLLMTLANSQNYSFFFAIVTFIRIGLLGLTMSIYLKEKKLSNLSIVVLSTVYALMGFTSAYYYNYIWLDSIILLPLVFLGLENLLKKGKSITYILTLALAIICNYYIGYIICLFVGIYFLSQLFISTNKKALLKSFVLSTLLALLLSSFVTIPSFFALLEGKASNFSLANLNGVALDWYRIPYLMMSGSSLRNGFKFKGVSQVYTSILVLALVLFYFLNRNIDKKEKRASLGVVIFFYLSFSLNALNLIWHMFQQPIWWSSRFSFCFSFFLIKLAADELAAFEDMPQNKRLKLLTINSLVILFSSITIFFKNSSMTYINLVFLLFSVCLLAIYILFLGRFPIKVFLLLTILDVGLNTYVNLSINKDAYMKSVSSQELRRSKNTIDAILSEDDDFYRIERVDKTLVNDGLYYGYPTITYFNSVSNTRTNRLLNSLGFETTSALVDFYKHSATEPLALDPFVMSILNIKYFEGSNDYLTKVEDEFYKNEHPLSLGFLVPHTLKELHLDSSPEISLKEARENLNALANSMAGEDINIYNFIDYTNFTKKDETYTYKVKADRDYLLLNGDIPFNIEIDKKEMRKNEFNLIKKGETLTLKIDGTALKEEDIYCVLFDINEYLKLVDELEDGLLSVTKTKSVLKGEIEVTKSDSLLYTSIAYLDGMDVYVDDELVFPTLLLDNLIGIELDEGFHTIEIKYLPKGLKTGLILTSVGFVLLCMPLIKKLIYIRLARLLTKRYKKYLFVNFL